MSTALQTQLRNALVAEKICSVDNSEAKTIENPYITNVTAAITGLTGTYAISDITTTDDTLTVNNEIKVGVHVYDFESRLANFDLFNTLVDDLTYSVAFQIDKFVLNNLCEDATGSYTTPAGGFTTPANVNPILANLSSKVMGYGDTYKGLFLVIENTDVVGFMQTQLTNGFSYADAALKNGFMTRQAGVDIFVVRSGTFVDATIGTTTVTNSGHRVFGVMNVATYASPRGIQYEEKAVSGKTGMEVVVYGYVGFKLWATKADLIVDITLA